MYLAQMDIYPVDLLERIMQPDYIKKVYHNDYMMGIEYLYLDQSLEIDCPHYVGPRLDQPRLAKLLKVLASFLPLSKWIFTHLTICIIDNCHFSTFAIACHSTTMERRRKPSSNITTSKC